MGTNPGAVDIRSTRRCASVLMVSEAGRDDAPCPAGALRSLEITRPHRDLAGTERTESSSDDVHHLPIALELPLLGDERRELHHPDVVLDERLRHDHVDEADLVLEQ